MTRKRRVTKRRVTKRRNTNKLKELCTCRVVLNDIALDTNLISLYQLNLPQKKDKEQSLSYINTFKNYSNTQLKKGIQTRNLIANEKYRMKRNLKNVDKQTIQNKCNKTESQLSYKNVQANKDILLNYQCSDITWPKVTIQRQKLICNSNVKSLSNTSNDETSNTSSYSDSKKMAISINNKIYSSVKKPNVQMKSELSYKRKLDHFNESNIIYDISTESTKAGSDSTNCSNKINLAFIDYDSEMQEVSSDSIMQMQYNNNMQPVDINKTNYELEQQYREGLENGISVNGTAEGTETNISSRSSYFSNTSITYDKRNEKQDAGIRSTNCPSLTINNIAQATNSLKSSFSSDLKPAYSVSKANNVTVTLFDFKIHNEGKLTSKKANKPIIKQKLPKITEDNILPQGTIKFLKIHTVNNSLQNDVSEQNRCNNSNRNTKTHIDTIETTNILRKEYHTSSEINGLNNNLNVSKNTLAFNNNINLKVENVSNTELHGKVNDCRNLNSLIKLRNNNINIDDVNNKTSITHKKYTLNDPVQSTTLDDNNEIHKINLLQVTRQCKEMICNRDMLYMDTSDLIDDNKDANKSCNISKALISVNEEEIVRQNRKRSIEETYKSVNPSKIVKLNRDSWLQNNAKSVQSKRYQQFDNFPSTDTTVTVDSNIMSKDEIYNSEEMDLRKHLNKKRSQVTSKLESTFENNYNNKASEEFKQTNLNNKNDEIITTNVAQNDESGKKLFAKKKSIFNETFEEENNVQLDPTYNNSLHLQNTLKETEYINQIDTHEDTNIEKERTNSIASNKEDDDCISLFATESFDITLSEDIFLREEDKLDKSEQQTDKSKKQSDKSEKQSVKSEKQSNKSEKQSDKSEKQSVKSEKQSDKTEKQSDKSKTIDTPYVMSNNSIDKYIKQNTNEFNKEYAECIENSIRTSNESSETKGEYNNQQTLYTNVPATAIRLTIPKTRNIEIQPDEINFSKIFFGYCFMTLRRNICNNELCRYKHNFQDLINRVNSGEPILIIQIIQYALHLNYNFFSEKMYVASLEKLTVNQIFIMYQTFHNYDIKIESLLLSMKYITHSIIKELLNRQMPLKMIVQNLMVHSLPTKNLQLKNILAFVERYIKPGEYWNTVKTLILKMQPNVHIIQKVLLDCIENKKLLDIQDVNNSLISKLQPTLILALDKHIMGRFKTLLTEKTEDDSHSVTVAQDFGKNLVIAETIASPDSNESARFSQMESPKRHNINDKINANKIENHTAEEINLITSYMLQRIDNLPDTRSVYRDHENLWRFYVDLDRFKKGLIHKDYDYVINILKDYSEKQDESSLFFRSCCNILRTEIKRSEYHLANIIRRTVQMDTFSVLSKILFDMTSDILISLMDQEAWVLALWLIQSIDTYDLPYNAEFFLLSAEIYLANKKAVQAYDLLKNKNIIHNNREKWYVESTINDEHTRNKIMYILLDLLCKEFFEHAFFLFQFLLKNQASQYFPIDLSRYVDKLIMLSLLQKNTKVTTEIGNLILKYDFALRTTTCRSLISTLVHIDEILARQIYNYAEGIGIYSTVKLWPVTYIVINTDLTEEEIYLTILQLLKNLLISFGHTIEFAKPQQVKAYLILEIKSKTESFYCAELLSCYNSKIITMRKTLVRNVLKNRFDPPILLLSTNKNRICRLQSTSLVNYLKSEHCY